MEIAATAPWDTIRAAFEAVCPHERFRPAHARDVPYTNPTDHLEQAHSRVPLTGLTYFFRHEALSTALAQTLPQKNDGTPLRVLAAPSSIGCEAYTLSAIMQQNGHAADSAYGVDAFDISRNFTQIARGCTYPVSMLRDLSATQSAMLFDGQETGEEFVRVRENIAKHVRFLDPQPFETFTSHTAYDAVMVNNMFVYMTGEQISATVKVIDQICDSLFVFLNKTNGGDISYFAKRPASFVDIADHPRWNNTPLARFVAEQPHMGYSAWARLAV